MGRHALQRLYRERLAEIGQPIQQAEQREHEVEVEYEACRLLHDTLRAAESTESAHLGRALAGPVGARFRQLTGGRYGDIGPGQTRRASADGRVHAVDLAAVIRRFDVMRPTTTARRSRELEEA